MPNRDIHVYAGAAAGRLYSGYLAWGQPEPHILAETIGGTVGGIGGGLLPDRIDTPCSPRHRAEAHSLSLTGTLGYAIKDQLPAWQDSLRKKAEYYSHIRAASPALLSQVGYGILEFLFRFLAGALAGLLAGYASHLALDSLTPSSLLILC